jgi:hypothetical protein
MSRMGLRLVGAALLALLLTGCIKLNIDLNVSSSNTVDGTMIVGVNKQLLAITGQSADQLLQSAAPPTDVPGLSSKPYEDDTYTGEQFSFEGVPLEKFNGSGPEDLRIERQGDVFTVSGVLDLSSASGASGITGPSGLGDAVNKALGTADIRISMTFPGAVTRSNGEVDGNTVTWRPRLGQRLELQATAKATGGGSSSTILLIVIAAAAVVVIVIVALALSRRSKGGAPGAPSEEPGSEGMEMAPTPSAPSSMAPPMPPAPPGVVPPPPVGSPPAMPPPAPGPSEEGMSPPSSSEEEPPPAGG